MPRGEAAPFEPTAGSWTEHAGYEGLRSVLDPGEETARKNAGIDRLHRSALASALGRRRYRAALDLGCGTGRLLDFLGARADHVLATDITPAMLRRARRENPHLRALFALGDGVRLPFADGSLDLIVSVYVLQYAVADRDLYVRILAELRRVLARDGQVVLLEQASFAGGTSRTVPREAEPDDYLGPAGARPFRRLRSMPVRLGSPDRVERAALALAARPGPLGGAAACALLGRNARLARARLARQTYVDWLLCLAPGEGVR